MYPTVGEEVSFVHLVIKDNYISFFIHTYKKVGKAAKSIERRNRRS